MHYINFYIAIYGKNYPEARMNVVLDIIMVHLVLLVFVLIFFVLTYLKTTKILDAIIIWCVYIFKGLILQIEVKLGQLYMFCLWLLIILNICIWQSNSRNHYSMLQHWHFLQIHFESSWILFHGPSYCSLAYSHLMIPVQSWELI